uniref:Uncharacterized protein n=1 Tax=Rhizophora mucronata TaxID=61149 RepID=A0A2P2J2L3_RHIMU
MGLRESPTKWHKIGDFRVRVKGLGAIGTDW